MIKEKDLPAYFKKGWEFVSTLNREKGVIKRKLENRKERLRAPNKKRRTERNGGSNINGAFQIIEEAEIIPHLEQGYEIIKELPNGKIVIRKTI